MRLDVWLKQERLTQQQFAEKIGLSRGYVGRIICGLQKPSKHLARLIEIETGGQVTAAELLVES